MRRTDLSWQDTSCWGRCLLASDTMQSHKNLLLFWTNLHLYYGIIWNAGKFLPTRRLKSLEMWCCVTGWVVLDVSGNDKGTAFFQDVRHCSSISAVWFSRRHQSPAVELRQLQILCLPNAWRHILEDSKFHNCCCNNLKSHEPNFYINRDWKRLLQQ